MDQRRNLTAFQMFPFGFTVTQPPPELDGYMGYQPSPTPSVALASSTSIAVPPQTLVVNSAIAQATFDTPGQSGSPTLALVSDELASWATGPDGATCLALAADGNLTLSLGLANAVNFTFGVEVAMDPTWPHAPLVTLEVNGQHVVTRQKVSNDQFALVEATVDGSLVQAGQNTLVVHSSSKGKGSNLLIRAVHASSEAVDIQAEYFWSMVAQDTIPAGGTLSFSVATTSGVTSTDTETQTFAETIGVNVGASGSLEGFGDISAQLNASFTATQSYSTSIALTQSTTDTTTITLAPPQGDAAVSYQIWQLNIQFIANGQKLVQALDPDAYLFTREVDENGNVIL